MLVTLTLSIVIGLLLGLLGGGGSILTVPMLVYVLGVEPKSAILTSFVVVGFSSLLALPQHAFKGNVCWKSGLFFGLAGMAGAFGGGRLAALLSGELLMALFGGVTLLTGAAMLRPPRDRNAEVMMRAHLSACPARVPYGRVLFDGFFVGALTGLVGVGGGFLIVPALTLLVGLPMRAAVGTSLFIIVMNAAAGWMGYAQHAAIDLPLTGIVTAGAVVGSLIGGMLSARIDANVLRRVFGILVLSLAGFVLYQSLDARLLLLVAGLLLRHVEFLLGILTLGLILMFWRIGAWLHRPARRESHFGTGGDQR
jgi:uncharacterized membrane protein YfcA